MASLTEFAGRVALITGTSGIGRAVALRLASEGARVLALGIDQAANATLQADGVEVRTADVTVEADVQAAVAFAEESLGGLDILVNAAAIHPFGTARPRTPRPGRGAWRSMSAAST